MTKKRDLKLLIRNRMTKTGESYLAARRHLERPANAPAATGEPIKGWRAAGTAPEAYEFAIDQTQGYQSRSSARVRSRSGDASRGCTTLMQQFLAHDYHGKRLRLSGWVRAEDLTGACRLWMRLDENTELLLFARSPSLTGTTEWTKQEIVLDVDAEATLISIGLLVDGAGAAWLSDVAVEVVGTDVPVTASREIPSQPTNLRFSE